jgi:hypothetical protein
MVRRRLVGPGLALALGVGLPACAALGIDTGSDPASRLLCVPGRSVTCVGVAGCAGYQVCNPEGRSYGGCNCDAPQVATAPAGCSGGSCQVAFASGGDWKSYSGVIRSGTPATYAAGAYLGPARVVCLSAQVPAGCPSGALVYGAAGFQAPTWGGGQGLTNASWIWRADVTATATAPFVTAIFEKTFTLGDKPAGTIQLAADDFAQVFVNQAFVGSVGSVVYQGTAARAQNAASTLDLTLALRAGLNTVTVVAQNGPFNCDSPACPYSQNPAGVIFSGSFHW